MDNQYGVLARRQNKVDQLGLKTYIWILQDYFELIWLTTPLSSLMLLQNSCECYYILSSNRLD